MGLPTLYSEPDAQYPKLQEGFHRKGSIAEDGTRKLAFYTVQKVYARHPVGRWSSGRRRRLAARRLRGTRAALCYPRVGLR